MKLAFRLNGAKVVARVPPAKPLLWVLREDLGLTGAKPGCETGECGACTVLLDGRPVASCLTLATRVEGHDVVTIEGLSKGGKIDPLVQSFAEEAAMQCGYCTPGFIMSAKGLLMAESNPSIEDIKRQLSGNLCRCGSYERIIKAVTAARRTRSGSAGWRR